MKDNRTEIIFLVDKSGSMYKLKDDTIGGYNSFINDQKKDDGETFLTTVLFDTNFFTLHDHVNVHDAEPLTDNNYQPHGCTALLDAIGYTIDRVGERLASTPEDERPAHVIFVITTDGYENSSEHYSRERVKTMIQHQETKYSWNFLFIGAGIDAYTEADSIGIGGACAMAVTTDSLGTDNMFRSVTCFTTAAKDGNIDMNSVQWKVGDVGDPQGGTL